MRIAILGAGGLGSYLGAVLSQAGQEVVLVARGEHGEAVSGSGLQVHGPDGDFTAHPSCVTSASELEVIDIVFVTVKSFSLDAVAEQIRALAETGAVVVPLLNGVDATDRLRAHGVAAGSLVDGIAYFTAFRTAPGRIERKGQHQRLVIGSLDGQSIARLSTVQDAFAGTAVHVQSTADIGPELWSKMAVVCSLAALCGITGSSIGPIRAHPFGSDLQQRAIAEVIAVGRAVGVQIPQDTEERVAHILNAFPDDFYPSVLHDLKSGRPTEMDSLGGVISRLGRKAGVETPLCDAATCAVRLWEDRTANRS